MGYSIQQVGEMLRAVDCEGLAKFLTVGLVRKFEQDGDFKALQHDLLERVAGAELDALLNGTMEVEVEYTFEGSIKTEEGWHPRFAQRFRPMDWSAVVDHEYPDCTKVRTTKRRLKFVVVSTKTSKTHCFKLSKGLSLLARRKARPALAVELVRFCQVNEPSKSSVLLALGSAIFNGETGYGYAMEFLGRTRDEYVALGPTEHTPWRVLYLGVIED